MNRSQQCVAFLAITVTLFATAQCTRPAAKAQSADAQINANTVIVAAEPVPGPALQGRVEGKVLLFDFKGQDLRANALAHPPPEVWLVFPTGKGHAQSTEEVDSGVKVELPLEAQKLVREQWETALPAIYDWELGDVPSVESRRLLTVYIIQSSMKASRELRKVMIEAPDGRRPMASDEATDVASFVGKAAFDVVQQAKKFK